MRLLSAFKRCALHDHMRNEITGIQQGLNIFSVLYKIRYNNTSQQEFDTRKVYCVSNVTFHAESKYAIKIFPSPTVFVQWPF